MRSEELRKSWEWCTCKNQRLKSTEVLGHNTVKYRGISEHEQGLQAHEKWDSNVFFNPYPIGLSMSKFRLRC